MGKELVTFFTCFMLTQAQVSSSKHINITLLVSLRHKMLAKPQHSHLLNLPKIQAAPACLPPEVHKCTAPSQNLLPAIVISVRPMLQRVIIVWRKHGGP